MLKVFMAERQKDKHHRFTLGVYGMPELGEHEVVVWGNFWTRAFRIATQALEEELNVTDAKPSITRQQIKSLRENPVIFVENPNASEIQEVENMRLNPRNPDADYWLWKNGYVYGEIKKTSDNADLRSLGHWVLADQVELGTE